MYLNRSQKLKIFINQSVVGYGVETFNWLSYPFLEKTPPTKKFVIFGSGRSGSTLLTKLLDKHSQIECYGEILRRKMLFPASYIRRCSQTAKKPIFGFKLLSYQLQTTQTSIQNKKTFLSNMVADGYQIIYLERKNILRQALSVMYGYHRDQWHMKEKEKRSRDIAKMKINAVELKNWMDNIEELKSFEKQMLQSIAHIHIVYEEDLSQPESQIETLESVIDFLGVEHEPLSSDLKKVTPKKLSSFVENADEIIDYLSVSRYHKYLKMLDLG